MDKKQRIWVLVAAGTALLAITLALDLVVPYASGLDFLIRGAAMLAYMTIFLSIISSNYVRELVRYFGRSFVKVHHIATVTALIVMFLHPIGVALRSRSLGVFAPVISSWYDFFFYGGRQALYLFWLASLAALLRATWKGFWRQVHWLSYLAFWFATVHGLLIGANFQLLVVRIVAILMAVATVAVFVLKRWPKRPAARVAR